MKVSLLTIWREPNLGASLQAYATVRVLTDMGHNVEIVDFRLRRKAKRKGIISMLKGALHMCTPYYIKNMLFWYRFKQTRRYTDAEDLCNNPPIADLYLLGSDQVWNPDITKDNADVYLLNYAPPGKIKAAYASSFGFTTWSYNEHLTKLFRSRLEAFSRLSCRESDGVKILKDTFGVSATHVLDPTLLFNGYPEITGKIKYKNTLAFYQLNNDTIELEHLAKVKAADLGLKFINVNKKVTLASNYIWNGCSVKQWLRQIGSSQMVVTHSFHGVAMSIIYKRNFVVVYTEGNRISRIESLLSRLGLNDRLFRSIKEAAESDIWNIQIDYDDVYEKLACLRKTSYDYIGSIFVDC